MSTQIVSMRVAVILLPKKRRTLLLLIFAVLGLVLFSHSLLPTTDFRIEFPTFESIPKVPSPNLTRKLESYLRPRREQRVSCAAIIEGRQNEIKKARRLAQLLRVENVGISQEKYLSWTSSCRRFQQKRGYITHPLSWDEFVFPIAFSILVYADLEMAERLLRAIYRPQNYYCIHVDLKSDKEVFVVFQRIARCFSNVLLARRRLSVVWGDFTVLEADLVCMETLWPFRRWKYFINLTGQEFPLKSNADLVRILAAFDGANDVHATLSETFEQRWRYRFHVPPTWFQPVKGSVHVTVSRAFVDYVLHNGTAQQVLHWVRQLDYFQDEAFFSTLNHNPQLGVPGSYRGEPEQHPLRKPFLSRYKIWNTTEDYFCYADRWVRYICILTSGDLPLMTRSVQLFANKFFLNEDRLVISCLEEWLYNRTRDSFLGGGGLDVSYYHNLDFVWNQVKYTNSASNR